MQGNADVVRSSDGLPLAEPRTVHGICLDGVAAGKFAQAVKAGEFVIGLDLPLSSPLPEAWRRWCAAQGRPHKVREEEEPDTWKQYRRR